MLVRDALRRPLAEVELGSLQASLSRLSPTVSQAYVGVQVAVWSFNAPIGAWEPMLEPWNLILNGDVNSAKQVRLAAQLNAALLCFIAHGWAHKPRATSNCFCRTSAAEDDSQSCQDFLDELTCK